MKIIIIGLFSFIALHHSAFSQNLIAYDLYQYDLKTINPALTGVANNQLLSGFISVTDGMAEEVFINDIQSNLLIGYETKVNTINSGLGVILQNRRNGLSSTWQVGTLFNHQLTLKNDNSLIFGMGANFTTRMINFDNFNYYGDPLFVGKYGPFNNIDFDLGLSFYSKRLFAGIAVKNILESTLEKYDFTSYQTNNIGTISAIIGWNHRVSPLIDLNYYLFLVTDYEKHNFDLSLTSQWKNTIIVGMTYRHANTIDNFDFIQNNNQSRLGINAGINYRDKFRITGLVYSSYFGNNITSYQFSFTSSVFNE